MSTVWVDGGYNNTVIRHGAQQGIRVQVVKRPTNKGFHVLPRRWIVERALGWLMQNCRLVRDYEALPQRSCIAYIPTGEGWGYLATSMTSST